MKTLSIFILALLLASCTKVSNTCYVCHFTAQMPSQEWVNFDTTLCNASKAELYNELPSISDFKKFKGSIIDCR